MTPDLPEPTGTAGPIAWWQMTGESFAQVSPGHIYAHIRTSSTDLDHLEADALAVLAACAWARRGGGAP